MRGRQIYVGDKILCNLIQGGHMRGEDDYCYHFTVQQWSGLMIVLFDQILDVIHILEQSQRL